MIRILSAVVAAAAVFAVPALARQEIAAACPWPI
jgi:hypothetical protein